MTVEGEKMAADRLNTLALMAATLEAGDRALGVPYRAEFQSEKGYATRARALYKAVEDAEYPPK